MLEREFENLVSLVRTAALSDLAPLDAAITDLFHRISALGEPDVYTDGALDGVQAAIGEFATALRQASTLPRFTVARRRYNAKEALWALHDELHRQHAADARTN